MATAEKKIYINFSSAKYTRQLLAFVFGKRPLEMLFA